MLRTHTAGYPSELEEEENVFFIFHFFFKKKKNCNLYPLKLMVKGVVPKDI